MLHLCLRLIRLTLTGSHFTDNPFAITDNALGNDRLLKLSAFAHFLSLCLNARLACGAGLLIHNALKAFTGVGESNAAADGCADPRPISRTRPVPLSLYINTHRR